MQSTVRKLENLSMSTSDGHWSCEQTKTRLHGEGIGDASTQRAPRITSGVSPSIHNLTANSGAWLVAETPATERSCLSRKKIRRQSDYKQTRNLARRHAGAKMATVNRRGTHSTNNKNHSRHQPEHTTPTANFDARLEPKWQQPIEHACAERSVKIASDVGQDTINTTTEPDNGLELKWHRKYGHACPSRKNNTRPRIHNLTANPDAGRVAEKLATKPSCLSQKKRTAIKS